MNGRPSARPRAFDTLLVANRGEIALRVMRTARRLGYRTVAVYSDVDRTAPHVRAADDAVALGRADVPSTYLNADAIVAAARRSGAQAIHPGYGFLSERVAFAERCEREGIVFVGPGSAAMRALGDKAQAKRLLAATPVPVIPGYHGDDQSDAAFADAARALGFPLMIKAAAGGGGRGMRLVREERELGALLASARAEAHAAFGDGTLLLERALVTPRHVEVQIVADRFGSVVHFGERDCSVQRRYQKLIEEAPSPAVDGALRVTLGDAACAVARAAGYEGAGTIEFLLDADGAYYFIEANARLQVEHPVTEAIAGVDLVEWQLRVARGEPLPLSQEAITFDGWAMEARICAEDPARGFLPQTGSIVAWSPPAGLRTDHALAAGLEVSAHFDSLLAKVIAHGPTRDDARRALARALEETVLLGVPTNAAFLVETLRDAAFAAGSATTGLLAASAGTERFAHGGGSEREDRDTEDAALLAAVLRYAACAARGGFGGWSGWSASRRPPATVVIAGEDPATAAATNRVVCVEQRSQHAFAAELGERRKTVEIDASDASPRRRVNLDGRTHDVAFAEAGERLFVALGARTYAFADQTNVPAVSRTAAAASDGALRAPTGGRVLEVRIAAGDEVRAGTVAVVLEAMKIEHLITLPRAGRIASVGVAAGERVAPGAMLALYEEHPAGL